MTAPTSDREPVRLLDAQATPDALRDALIALQRRVPSPEAAARIGQRIEHPERPPPRALRIPIAITLMALLGGLAWLAWPAHRPTRAPSSAAPSQAPVLPLPETSVVERPGPSPARAPRAPLPSAPEPVGQTAPAIEPSAPPAQPEPVRAPRRPKPAPRAQPRAIQPIEELAAQLIEEPRSPSPPSAAEGPPSVSASASEDAERVFADPQDEAGLLYRAKRLSSSDPDAALRLIVLHEASFPDGAFAEERDVLEIQIHERLGHAATVKRLAAMFKRRYPGSVYRVDP